MSDLRVKDFTTDANGKVTGVTLLNGTKKDYKGGMLARNLQEFCNCYHL